MTKVKFLISMLTAMVIMPYATVAQVITFDSFMARVATYHPKAKQAQLQEGFGNAQIQMAKGAFDPKFGASHMSKQFDGKDYYSISDIGLKVKTPLGVSFNTGLQQANGNFLNPERSLPANGLFQLGTSLSIGQGLFTDEERTAIRRAHLFAENAKLNQKLMLNDLLFKAGKAYWEWYKYHQITQIYEEAVQTSIVRFKSVKQSAQLGDVPFIDTTEARIQLQIRQLKLVESQLALSIAELEMKTFLWNTAGQQVIIPNPSPGDITSKYQSALETQHSLFFDSLVEHHPVLEQFNVQEKDLEVLMKWKKEQLKPKVDLKYNLVSEPIGGDVYTNINSNNYQWGVSVGIPILLRKERGSIKNTALKINAVELKMDAEFANIYFLAKSALTTWENSINLIRGYEQNAKDYKTLLNGEKEKFRGGESSLFMVNARELNYIAAKIKLIESVTANKKASLTTSYALAILPQ